MLATGSRSPWAALIGGAAALGAVRKPRVFLVVVVAVAVIVGLSPPTSPLSFAHFRNSVHQAAGETLTGFSSQTEPLFSSAARVFLTVASLRAIAARPLVGYGLNAIESGAAIPTVDNYYLRLAMEVGIPVSLCILGGLVLGWSSLARRAQNGEGMLLTYAVGAYLVEFLFVGLRDSLPAVLLIMGYLWSHDGTATRGDRSRRTVADRLLNTMDQEGTD